jgi:hypothetical protein
LIFTSENQLPCHPSCRAIFYFLPAAWLFSAADFYFFRVGSKNLFLLGRQIVGEMMSRNYFFLASFLFFGEQIALIFLSRIRKNLARMSVFTNAHTPRGGVS